MVVCGKINATNEEIDEISNLGETYFGYFDEKQSTQFGKIEPNTLKNIVLQNVDVEKLKVSNPKMSAQILEGILSGEIKDAKRDLVLLNAAGGLLACGKTDSLDSGIKEANYLLNSGKALQKLRQMQSFYQKR